MIDRLYRKSFTGETGDEERFEQSLDHCINAYEHRRNAYLNKDAEREHVHPKAVWTTRMALEKLIESAQGRKLAPGMGMEEQREAKRDLSELGWEA